MSSKAKIGPLVAVHVIGGLLMAWYVNTHRISPVSNWISTGLLSLVLAQAGLIGVWGGLSTIRLAWRLAAVVVTTAFAWAVLFIANTAGGKFFAFQITLTVVPILVVLSVLRYSRGGLRLAHLANESPAAKGLQFSIRHLLLATAIVAIVLGIGRGVRTFSNMYTVIMATLSLCFIMVELATLWAVLGMGRPTIRLPVVVATALVAGTVSMHFIEARLADWRQWMLLLALVGLHAIITAASLLVVRSCGWRMVRSDMPIPEQSRRFRLRFSLWHLFLLVTLVAVGFGTWHWLTRKVVVVRAATPEDKELFAGYIEEGMDNADPSHTRNVVVATGQFMRGTWLLVSLHVVQACIVEQASEHRFGRDEKWTKGPLWETINWLISLDEYDAIGGQTTELTITDDSDDKIYFSENFTDVTHNINVIAKKTVPGKITPGRPRIVYVEGDQWINVDGKMTVEKFAKANPGNYLVVTVEVR